VEFSILFESLNSLLLRYRSFDDACWKLNVRNRKAVAEDLRWEVLLWLVSRGANLQNIKRDRPLLL
jgi:hypothetical protein